MEVIKDKLYCTEHYCWDRNKYPFCLCGDTRKDISKADTIDTGTSSNVPTACDLLTNNQEGYLPDSFQTYNNSFHNPLIGIVRLIVLLSTENYPDIMCKYYPFNIPIRSLEVTKRLTKTTAAQNEVALSYHRVRRLYFVAVVFVTTICKLT